MGVYKVELSAPASKSALRGTAEANVHCILVTDDPYKLR